MPLFHTDYWQVFFPHCIHKVAFSTPRRLYLAQAFQHLPSGRISQGCTWFTAVSTIHNILLNIPTPNQCSRAPVLEAYGMTEAAPDDIKSRLLQWCCKGRKGKECRGRRERG